MENNSFLKTDNAPPTAFYFSVKFDGFDDMDNSFQVVSGLNATIGTVEKREGGDNNFVHHLPIPLKYENLILKRCLLLKSSWINDSTIPLRISGLIREISKSSKRRNTSFMNHH